MHLIKSSNNQTNEEKSKVATCKRQSIKAIQFARSSKGIIVKVGWVNLERREYKTLTSNISM